MNFLATEKSPKTKNLTISKPVSPLFVKFNFPQSSLKFLLSKSF